MNLCELPDTACELFLLELPLPDLVQLYTVFPTLALYENKYFLGKYCSNHHLPQLDNIQEIVACQGQTVEELQLLAAEKKDSDYLLTGEEIPADRVLTKALVVFGVEFILQLYAKFLPIEVREECINYFEPAKLQKTRKCFSPNPKTRGHHKYELSCCILGYQSRNFIRSETYVRYGPKGESRLAYSFAIALGDEKVCLYFLSKEENWISFAEECYFLNNIDFGLTMIRKRPEIFVRMLEQATLSKRQDTIPALQEAFNEGCRLRLEALK